MPGEVYTYVSIDFLLDSDRLVTLHCTAYQARPPSFAPSDPTPPTRPRRRPAPGRRAVHKSRPLLPVTVAPGGAHPPSPTASPSHHRLIHPPTPPALPGPPVVTTSRLSSGRRGSEHFVGQKGVSANTYLKNIFVHRTNQWINPWITQRFMRAMGLADPTGARDHLDGLPSSGC